MVDCSEKFMHYSFQILENQRPDLYLVSGWDQKSSELYSISKRFCCSILQLAHGFRVVLRSYYFPLKVPNFYHTTSHNNFRR